MWIDLKTENGFRVRNGQGLRICNYFYRMAYSLGIGIGRFRRRCVVILLYSKRIVYVLHAVWGSSVSVLVTSYKYPLFRWLMSYEVMKFQLRILKTVRMHVEFTFIEWLTLYSRPLWGTVKSSIVIRHRIHIVESSYRIVVQYRIVNLSTNCLGESLTCLVKFQLCILKTV